MKILVVTARYYPEQFSIVNICEEFIRLGHEVTVVTGKPNYGYWKIVEGYENINEEEINGVKVIRLNELARKKGAIGLLRNYHSINKIYARFYKKHKGDYDVVLSHVISPIFTMRGLKQFCKKNNLPHVHYGLDLWPESLIAASYFKRNNPFFNIMKRYSKKLYSSVDYMTFASPSVEAYFRNYLKLKNLRFKHIYQPTLTIKPDLEIVRNKEYKTDGKISILYIGSIARFHRLELFLEALEHYNKLHITPIRFDVVGSGSELDNLKNKVKELGIENYVTFHGRVPVAETRKYMLNADVLYVPLYNNSATSKMIPQKLIEYLMYNRPIMGMITGDGKKILEDASSYNIICDQSIGGLIKGLKKVENQKENFKRWGDDNRQYFDLTKRFLLPTITQELLEVCNIVVEEKSKKHVN